MALLDRLRVASPTLDDATAADAAAVLQEAITAVARADTIAGAVAAAAGGSPAAQSLAGALVGAHVGRAASQGINAEQLPHGDRALHIARRLAEQAAREQKQTA